MSCPCTKSCSCSRKKSSLALIAGAVIGCTVTMLFTENSGETLRKKLSKSKTPIRDFFVAHMEMKMSAYKYLHGKVKELLEKK